MHLFKLKPEVVRVYTDEALEYMKREFPSQTLTDINAMVRAHCVKIYATAASGDTKVGCTKLVSNTKARH